MAVLYTSPGQWLWACVSVFEQSTAKLQPSKTFGNLLESHNFTKYGITVKIFINTIRSFIAGDAAAAATYDDDFYHVPASIDLGHVVFGLSVCPFVCLFVCKNIYIGHIF